MKQMQNRPIPRDAKLPWEAPAILMAGSVREIVGMPGGGKLSIMAADGGDEQRKPKGQA